MNHIKVVAMRTAGITAKNILEQLKKKNINSAVVSIFVPSVKNNTLVLNKKLASVSVKSEMNPVELANAIQSSGGWNTRIWMGGEYQRVLRNLNITNERGELIDSNSSTAINI